MVGIDVSSTCWLHSAVKWHLYVVTRIYALRSTTTGPASWLASDALCFCPSTVWSPRAAAPPIGLVAVVGASGAEAQILGTAEDFGVLAGTTAINTGPSAITGGMNGRAGFLVAHQYCGQLFRCNVGTPRNDVALAEIAGSLSQRANRLVRRAILSGSTDALFWTVP